MRRLGTPVRVVAAACLWLLGSVAYPMITVGGAGPIEDMGWPSGALSLINLESRFRYTEGPPYGGGLYSFEYKGGTAEFTEALDVFSRIAAPGLELVVHSGRGQGYATNDDEGVGVDWRFTVWVPENFYRLYRNPNGFGIAEDPSFGAELPAPRIDVYVGENPSLDFENVVVPAGVQVLDHRRPQGNLLKGAVYDMNSGKAVMGATVTLNPHDASAAPVAAYTDLLGRYSFEDLPRTNFKVEVRAKGYAPRQEGYFGGREHEYRETTTLLAKTAELSGIVVNEGGVPIQGVEIWAAGFMGLNGKGYPSSDSRRQVVSGPDGGFRIADVPEGYIRLQSGGDWYFDPFTKYSTANKDIRIVVQRRGAVRITLLQESGAAFDGEAMLELYPAGGVGGFGGDRLGAFKSGVWEWDGIPPGDYFINIQIPGVYSGENPSRQRFTVKSEGTPTITLRYPKMPATN